MIFDRYLNKNFNTTVAQVVIWGKKKKKNMWFRNILLIPIKKEKNVLKWSNLTTNRKQIKKSLK